MKNKLVIFDFADTIAKLSPSKEDLLKRFIEDKIDIHIDIRLIEEVYHYATNLIFYSSVDIKSLKSKRDFYIKFNQDILNLLGLGHKLNTEELFEYFNDNGQHWILKDNVKELFEELKSKGCLLSLVSNFDTRLSVILEEMNITHYFDSIFISQEIGLEKPNVQFFELPLNEHSCTPRNSFFIGDSYVLDYIPANKIGIHSILLDEKNLYPMMKISDKIENITDCKNLILKS